MKALRLAAGILLVSLALWPALPASAESVQQVWVDDNYCSSCTNDGHAWGVDAFATISAALRAAAPGATVHVMRGVYREDVRIDWPVRLKAEGTGVILMPQQAEVALTVAANDVAVDGLEIAGGKQAGILVMGPDFQRLPIRNIAITGNVVHGGLFGIAVNIDPAWNYGALTASRVEIRDNTVSGCTRALYVYNTQAEIRGNSIAGLAPEGIGIYSSQGSVTRIQANTVRVDAPAGRGIYILDNQGTVVDSNALVGTSDVLTPTTAISLYGFDDLVLSNNSIEGFYWGTSANTGGTARIERNTFRGTAARAMSFGTAITTTQVTIADNVVRGSYWGLRLDDDGHNGLQATVTGNSFVDDVVGIELAPSVGKDQVAVHGNTLCGNLSVGLRNESAATIDATENWWGGNDGPWPAGRGDRVEGTGSVLVDPWLRVSASATLNRNGSLTITAVLAGTRYRLAGVELRFSADQGVFASGSSHWTTKTDADGRAQAVLTLGEGERATVTIDSACGSVLSLGVPPGTSTTRPSPRLPLVQP